MILKFARAHWLLVCALALGLAARLIALAAHSLLLDEAFVTVGARDMLYNGTPMWDAISNAPFVWLLARALGKGGLENIFLLRLTPALFGAASILPLYFIGKRFFGPRIAGVAALLFAVHPFAVAFSRVLFADAFQVFFILCGFLAFDHFATNSLRDNRRAVASLLGILVIWGLAFLMKYNAVVPGGLWVLAGLVSGRYYLGPSFLALSAMTLGSVIMLAAWPYDAPVWFAAFLEKGGSYDVQFSAYYFQAKLRLVLYGVTEATLLGSLFFALSERGRSAEAFGHLVLFLLTYLRTITFLGRCFERYLLVMVPIACLLVAALVLYLFRAIHQGTSRFQQVGGGLVSVCLAVVFLLGEGTSWREYIGYLRNDYDHASIARDALKLEHEGRAGFWLLPEPIGAYYLGYTRHYSRSTERGQAHNDTLPANYFEGQPVSYELETAPFGVLEVRRLLRSWGFWRAALAPAEFVDSARTISRVENQRPRKPAEDYLTSSVVIPGSLLILESGFRDIQGEPILEDIRGKSGPPTIAHLPTTNFSVIKAYRPEGFATPTDTVVEPNRAGAWILMRK